MESARRTGPSAASLALLAATLLGIPLLTGQLGALAALRAALGFLLVAGLPGYALAVAAGVPAERDLRISLAPALGTVAAMAFHTASCALLADRMDPLAVLPALPVLAAVVLWTRREAGLDPRTALARLMPALAVLAAAVLLVELSQIGFGAEDARGFCFPLCGAHGAVGQYALRLNLLVRFDQQVTLPAPALSGMTAPYYHLFPAALDSLLFRISGATALTTLAELRPVYALVVLVPAAWGLLRVLGLGRIGAALGAALVCIGSEGLPLLMHMAFPRVALGMGVFAAMLALVALGLSVAPRALVGAALLLGAQLQIRPGFFLCGGGGLMVIAAAQWWRTRRLRLVALGAGALATGLAVAGLQLLRTRFYGDGPYLRWAPLEGAQSLLVDPPDAPPGAWVALGIGLLAVLVAFNLRLIGLGLWAAHGRGRRSLVEWWMLAAAGLALLAAATLTVGTSPAFVAMVPSVGLGCLAFVAARGLHLAYPARRRLVIGVVLLGLVGGAVGSAAVVQGTVECAMEDPLRVPYAKAGALGWIREHTDKRAVLLAPAADTESGLLPERMTVVWLPPEHETEKASLLGMGFLMDECRVRAAAVDEFYTTTDPRRAAAILARYRVGLVLTTPARGLHFPAEGLLTRHYERGGFAAYSVAGASALRR